MSFSVGSLVRARGREWVVLPESELDEGLLVLRPLGGTDAEIAGVYLPLEHVEPATFAPPDPARDLGDHLSARLLRDAVRLGFRSGAGPFRSIARIAVEPRPYQLVPLLMALRLDPVRMLIADDVGIGKTIEALLIARELFDRGEVQRTCVLCPPHLAEQWQRALREQFHLPAELVLPGTAARLEREAAGRSLFECFPHVVVSLDYVKSDRRRETFLRACPELVIVDEAHTCASPYGRSGRAQQRRHEVLRRLAADPNRHLLLVTATPHSGKEQTFRSLLGLLDPRFEELSEEPADRAAQKQELAKHFVQRRRGDIESYLSTDTPFPKRDQAEDTYTLHPEHRALFDDVLAWCEETVRRAGGERHRQRVQWWSALALLRALGSSPAAAAATLRVRAAVADAASAEEADELGRRTVMDDAEESEGADVEPGSQIEDVDDESPLAVLARRVEALSGRKDHKLARAIEIVRSLIDEGFRPILFCRFIATAKYVAAALSDALQKGVHVDAVTGDLPPELREQRIEAFAEHARRVLVCTDCLSEGINLQHRFDAVVHYDLSWNPTRHEQREGRVDRYGQLKKRVRTLTYYGKDNPVDGIVLEVLLRKQRAIQSQLGISVPVPVDTDAVIMAIIEGLTLRRKKGGETLTFDFMHTHEREALEVAWDEAVEREKQSRTVFAQRTIKVDEVQRELDAVRAALGGTEVVERFTLDALQAMRAVVSRGDPVRVDLRETPRALRDRLALDRPELALAFGVGTHEEATVLDRAHPIVEAIASHVVETALDPALAGPGARSSVIRTRDVSKRTTAILLRMRFHIVQRMRDGVERPLLAEDALTVAFRGSPARADWLGDDEIERLLRATPSANVPVELAREQLRRVADELGALSGELDARVHERAAVLLDAHRRVRSAAKLGVRAVRVEPQLPADLLGVYVYLPAGAL